MCGNCPNCSNKVKEKLPEERLELGTKHVFTIDTVLDTPIGAIARIKIGENVILSIEVESPTEVSVKLEELGD